MSDADDLLARWQQRLATISANANALNEAEFCVRIRNRLRDGRYTGLTLERAGHAMADLNALMDDYLILARVVEDAAEAARGGLFQPREAIDARVRALLDGESVALPAVHVPLQQRDLLTDASRVAMTTPAAVLDAMQAAFLAARDGLTAIDQAEQGIDTRFAALRLELRTLAARAAAVGLAEGEPGWPQSDGVSEDPLAQYGALQGFGARVAAWRAAIDAAERERDAVQQALGQARLRLNECQALVDRWAESRTALAALLGDCPDQPGATDWTEARASLTAWLANLEHAATEGRWHAVATGLARFEPTLATQLATGEQLCAAIQAPINAYADLKARFKVLRTKAATLRERDHVTGMETEEATIADAFHRRPADLQALATQVAAFEHQLLIASQKAHS